MTFAASNGVITLAAAVTSALLARSLTTSDFGSLSFATSFLGFSALFFEFGLFLPIARLAALADVVDRRAVAGAALATFLPVALLFSLTTFVFSFLVDHLFHVHAGTALRVAAPLAFIYPFAQFGLLLTQGDGRLHLYSLSSAAGQLLYLVLVVVVAAAWGLHGPVLPLFLRGLALGAGSLGLVICLRPVFVNVRQHARRFAQHARDYGFRVFVGRVLSIGTYNMDVLMLAALTRPSVVALYTIAGKVTTASGLPITGLSSALFPQMVKEGRLQGRWLLCSWLFGLGCVGVLWLVARPLLTITFSHRYVAAAALIVPLALAQAIRGVTGIYNGFLSAHGKGVELSRAAVVLTVSNIVLNLALIPPFGALGAAWASFGALVINLGAHVAYYRRVSDSGGESAPAPEPAATLPHVDAEPVAAVRPESTLQGMGKT
jgi:O-antigen/teichoic acid export membrane protein